MSDGLVTGIFQHIFGEALQGRGIMRMIHTLRERGQEREGEGT